MKIIGAENTPGPSDTSALEVPGMILVVGNPGFCATVSKALTPLKHLLLTATSTREALKVATQNRIGLALVYERMGLELCQEIKSLPNRVHVSVLYAVHVHAQTDQAAAFKSGVSDVLYLPIRSNVLMSRVRSALKYHEAILKLHESREALERRVKERTQELERANADLRREIEKRKKAEDAVQRSVQTLRGVLVSSPLAMFGLDRKMQVQICWNPAAEKMFGWQERDVLGQALPKKMGIDPEKLGGILNDALQGNAPGSTECRAGRRDGSKFEVALYAAPLLTASGQPHCALMLMADISERKLLEDRLRQSQKMEAIGRMAGGIAHDFNNLLTIINGFGDLLRNDMKNGVPNRRHLDAILEAGGRAADLTKLLLVFSRRQNVEPRVVDLNQIVLGLEGMLRRVIREDILFDTRLSETAAYLMADPTQLEQVLLNLVVNGRDAMPSGGNLSISTRNVELKETLTNHGLTAAPGPYVLLSVQDTGSGMSEEVQTHLFEPFFTTKDQGKGTGLGLSTVYGIVSQGKGFITVRSALGKGTEFQILMPRATETAVLAAKANASGAQRPVAGKETILLVEDEPGILALAQEVLTGAGYHVLAASGGRQALDCARKHDGKIELLLSDVVMPEMNGRQLASELTSQRPNTKVLFISGYTDLPLDAGAAVPNLISKPFEPRELLATIRAMLDKVPA